MTWGLFEILASVGFVALGVCVLLLLRRVRGIEAAMVGLALMTGRKR